MNKFDEFFVKNKPEFVVGAVKMEQIPATNLPEIAFAGRSNVGKSSLLNAITKSNIAITSKTPGRTKQINFFNIADRCHFVDMPGYGYAKARDKEIQNWTELMYKYFLGRENLKRLFLLIDSRHGLKDNDREIMKVLDKYAVLYQIILTKTDDSKSDMVEKIKEDIKLESVKHTAMFPEILTVSSSKGYGISELREVIYNLLFNS